MQKRKVPGKDGVGQRQAAALPIDGWRSETMQDALLMFPPDSLFQWHSNAPRGFDHEGVCKLPHVPATTVG